MRDSWLESVAAALSRLYSWMLNMFLDFVSRRCLSSDSFYVSSGQFLDTQQELSMTFGLQFGWNENVQARPDGIHINWGLETRTYEVFWKFIHFIFVTTKT